MSPTQDQPLERPAAGKSSASDSFSVATDEFVREPVETPQDDFWVRSFASYLEQHRHPFNRASHMVGIPLLIVTAIAGLVMLDWRMFVGGQLLGWTIQVLGHRIERNRPVLLGDPVAFLMGPLMVLVEIAESFGMRIAFAKRAREIVQPLDPD